MNRKPNPSESVRTFYTVNQISDMLSVTAQTVSNWIHTGTLPASKIGRKYVIKAYDFDNFINEHRVVV